MNLRILFVEDSADDAELMRRRLRAAGIEPQWERVQSEDALRTALAGEPWDLALVDYNLPGFGGLEALAVLAEAAPDLPAITVSGAISEETAVATITAGAVDYVLKDNLTRLAPAVRRAVEGAALRRQHRRASEQARRTQFAIEHSSQGILYISEDGTILYINAAAERLGGIPLAEVIGEKIWEWTPAIDEQRWGEAWRAAAQHPIVDFEAPLRLPGGEQRLISATLDHHESDEGSFVIVYARDITGQRAVEAALQESEERFASAFRHSPIGMALISPEGKWLMVNASVCSIVGYSEAELLARTFRDITHPDDVDVDLSYHRQLLAGEIDTYTVEKRYIHKNGHIVWILAAVALVHDGAGAPLYFVSQIADITERKQAEEELRFTRFVVEQAGDSVFWMTADGAFRYANPTTCETLGYSLDELCTMTIHDIDPDFPAERWMEHMKELQQAGSLTFETHHRTKDGTIIPMEITAMYLEYDGDAYDVGFARDITERKQAEVALRESESRFRTMFEEAPLGVALIDSNTGHIYEVNPRFAEIAGRTQAEMRSIDWMSITHPDDAREGLNQMARLNAGAISGFQRNTRYLRPDGSVVWVSIAIAALEEPLLPHKRHLAMIEDITERKRAEEALRESEERFEQFADHFPGYMFMHDKERRYVYVNRLEAKDGDVLREDWLGKTPSQVWDGDDAVREEVLVQRALDGELVDVVVHWTAAGLFAHLHSIYFPMLREGESQLIGGISLDVTAQVEAQEEVRRQAEQLKRTVEGVVLAMGHVVESRDPYTAGHERRVAELAGAIAAHMGLDFEALEALRLAALIHDIGKIAVPAEILSKPGRLSEVEFTLIKQHPASGFEILGVIDFGLPVAEIVRQHHERLDGSGYPRALSGKEILPEARILAVADVVEAMSSYRPYRAALGMEAALAEVREHSGVKYDAEVVTACVRLVEEQSFAFTP